MNKGAEIIEAATDNLKRLTGLKGISFSKASSNKYDFTLKINGISFLVITFGNVIKTNYLTVKERIYNIKANGKLPVILVATYISPALTSDLSHDGINYIDKSGNCHIVVKNLILHISGQKQAKEKSPTGIAFNEAGLKLISYFLSDEGNVAKSYREISSVTGLSLGTIKNVIEDLKNNKFIFKADNRRRLMNIETLTEHWQLAYNTVLKPKLLLGRMDFIIQQDAESWMNSNLLQGDEWGGETGAYIADGYLKPEIMTLYTANSIFDLAKSIRLKPSKDGRVLVYHKFWTDEDDVRIAPKHIVYADLMGSGDSRCLEAAKRLMKK